jgi:uncharacterized protein involved in response to NO
MAHISLKRIEEPAATPGFDWRQPFATAPVLRLGFRPFYLLAALFAVLSVPLWLLAYGDGLALTPNVTVLWHMHEMTFGFMTAVVIGFLFTAGRNWTNLWTPRRGHLALLAALWIAGRGAMLFATPGWAALVDIAFLPAATWPMYQVLQRSGNKRNMPLLGLLVLLTIANAVYHAAMLGWLQLSPMLAVHAAILVLAVLSTVMGGRVIPGFTTNMAPGSRPKTNARTDKAGLALIGAASVAWLALQGGAGVGALAAVLAALLAAAAGVVHLWRLSGWSTLKTLRYPLLWILHLAYAWIGIGFLLLAGAAIGYGPPSTGIHALAVGAMSSLILGMITRTARGHTGRPVKAGRAESLAFAALQIGAVARVAANLVPEAWRHAALCIAGLAWSLSFALYLAVYTPWLLRARLDGRDG